MNLKDYLFILNDSALLTPVGTHTQLTQCSVVTTLTPPQGATRLIVQATGTVDVRYTVDANTAPTSSKGFVLVHDQPPIVIPVSTGAVVKLIQEAANAVVEYQWTGLPS